MLRSTRTIINRIQNAKKTINLNAMKTVKLIALFTLLAAFTAQAQSTFDITRVNGKITNLKTGKEVASGDVINADDQLLFESMDSYAIAIGSNMGRFQIKLIDADRNAEQPMLTATAIEVARPTKMRNLMLVRFDPSEKEISDLKQYFGSDKFSVIGNNIDIPISAKNYPLSDDKFIVFYYKVDNKPVQKKIGFAEQTLLLEKDKLTSSTAGTLSGNEISNLAVYQYEKTSRSSQEITRFTLVFVDKDELKNEFYTIIPILKRQKMADPDIKKYLIEYYYDFYGATDSKTIDRFAEDIVKNYSLAN